ncbi:MAG: hypothetical protein F6K62_02580 [Sphaerospermopsis sp. SIO1G2]|nr:hypothetical protein [Sphaerospermopsis sp. SIO1G1]NET69958.1 hypothetical protein [Sphaerospermopsis sp. SIO1G2]
MAAFSVVVIGGSLMNSLYQEFFVQDSVVEKDAVNTVKISNLETTNVAAVAETSLEVNIDKQEAFDSVWNLPQVQRKAKEIKNLSRGQISVSAIVDDYPTANNPFYIVRVFENHPGETTSPVYWFRVSSSNGVVEPLDLVENEYIDMEEWNPDGR